MRSIKARNISTRRGPIAKASESQLLNRLIGIETEYAFRYSVPDRRNSHALYRLLVASFATRLPLVESHKNPNRVFLANGGALSWEPNLNSLTGYLGFIEVATPQCRQPKQVVAYLTAFDHLIADALEDPLINSQDFVPMAAIRNSCDGFGQRYGQQENYEVQIASGVWLLLWWVGLAMLLPVLLLQKLFSKIALTLTLGRMKHDRACAESSDDSYRKSSRLRLSGMRLATFLLQICHAPLEYLFQRLCCAVLLRRHRRVLGAYLASRVCFDGSGHVDRLGVFRLSSRGMQINSFIGFSGNGQRKPMIDLHHWFRTLCLDDSRNLKAYRNLFRRRQRIQICCGDTSTNEYIRWIQVGATCLVLDLIESDRGFDFPRFKLTPDALIQRFSKRRRTVCRCDSSRWFEMDSDQSSRAASSPPT